MEHHAATEVKPFDMNTVFLNMNTATADQFEESGISLNKLVAAFNEGTTKDDRNASRRDIHTAKLSKFFVEEGFNVRDNGHKYGIDPAKARKYADRYIAGKKLPPLTVMPVVMDDGSVMLKIVDGHNRFGGAHIKLKETGIEQQLEFVFSDAKNAAEQVEEMLECEGLALSIIDKGNGYRRLVREFGQSERQIAERFSVSVKEVKDGIRLSEMPEFVKAAIRSGSLAPSRALKEYDNNMSKLDAEAAIELYLEGNVAANSELPPSSPKNSTNTESEPVASVAKPVRRRSNQFAKRSIGKPVVEQMSQSVSEVSNLIINQLGVASVNELPKDTTDVSINIPIDMLRKLMAACDELDAINTHNENIDMQIAQRKAEKKAANIETPLMAA